METNSIFPAKTLQVESNHNYLNISKTVNLILIYSQLTSILVILIASIINNVGNQYKQNNYSVKNTGIVFESNIKLLIRTLVLSIIYISPVLISLMIIGIREHTRKSKGIKESIKVNNRPQSTINIILQYLILLLLLRSILVQGYKLYKYFYLNHILIMEPNILLKCYMFKAHIYQYRNDEIQIFISNTILYLLLILYTIGLSISIISLYKYTSISMIYDVIKSQFLITTSIKYIRYKIILIILLYIYGIYKIFQLYMKMNTNIFNVVIMLSTGSICISALIFSDLLYLI